MVWCHQSTQSSSHVGGSVQNHRLQDSDLQELLTPIDYVKIMNNNHQEGHHLQPFVMLFKMPLSSASPLQVKDNVSWLQASSLPHFKRACLQAKTMALTYLTYNDVLVNQSQCHPDSRTPHFFNNNLAHDSRCLFQLSSHMARKRASGILNWGSHFCDSSIFQPITNQLSCLGSHLTKFL